MESHIQGQVWRSQEVQLTDIRQSFWVMAGDYKCPACSFPGPQGLDAEPHEITGIADNKQDLFWFFSLPYTTAEKLRHKDRRLTALFHLWTDSTGDSVSSSENSGRCFVQSFLGSLTPASYGNIGRSASRLLFLPSLYNGVVGLI